ncbi:MAG: putative LPS assembly protein LptD [Bacteroidales bacterium]|nr:putative LPS assembly protein LptD [Bacteroidales bacterium]
MRKSNYICTFLFFVAVILCFNTQNAYSQDSLFVQKQDSLDLKKNKKKAVLDARIDYSAEDSLTFFLDNKDVFLYNKAKIDYDKMKLESGFMTVNFDTKTLFAEGVKDSTDTITQAPIFKEGNAEYKSKELKYNFDTKQGLISNVFTKESDGYLHGEKVKKKDDRTMYISSGMFTTCDNEDHPHFGISFSKAKAITDDKIVTGPAWFSLMEIPLPVGIPFAYFPFTDGKKSGFLMPSYGNAANRGYYLRNIGWYFAINDYIDLALRGDIYTNLSYALNISSSYVKRYKYRGSIEFRYEDNHTGLKNTPSYSSSSDFKFRWTHSQEAKSHPYRTFSANVNLVSSKFNQYTTNVSDYFNNTTTSSIAFSTRFGSAWSFTANLGESYNINSGAISLDLPSMTLSSIQFYPFRKKKSSGKRKWYEDISFSYRANLINTIDTYDSLLTSSDLIKNFRNGIMHSIPISSNVKILKHLNWTNSISYTERWYTNSISKTYNPETDLIDKDTIYGFIANRNANFTSSINTRLYGMFTFKKGFIKAVRHVINPSISFNYTPDFSEPSLGFYDFYTDKEGKRVYYSKTENGVFGSPPQGASGVISFSLGNNLEMKVPDKNDTVEGMRKIVLLEAFNISSGYDLARDSVNWQPLRLTARTTLFKKLLINFSAAYTPYVLNENGVLTNELLWHKEGRLFQKQNSQWTLNMSWNLNSKADHNQTTGDYHSPTEMQYSLFSNPNEILSEHVDFSIPWNLTLGVNYSRLSSYIVSIAGYQTNQSATLTARGDLNLTEKWKIGFSSGYDFINKDFTYTSIDFYRDLHCWEMRMNWIPFGPRQGWNFSISVKAPMLQDLKYEKRNDFRNRMEY